jgi:hypothetical protein
MSENNKNRVLLSANNQLRKFFFIVPFEDGSFSFGSSLPKPQKMKLGKIIIPEGQQSGESRVNFCDAENIQPILSHFTYHPPRKNDPPILHLRSNTGNRIFEYPVDKLEDMEEFKRIFTIIPQDPTKLPIFLKKISPNDIIIPIDNFEGNPFCVEVFLCMKTFDYKRLLIKDASLIAMGICENNDYQLVIELYHKKEFKEWPKFTVFVPFVRGLV